MKKLLSSCLAVVVALMASAFSQQTGASVSERFSGYKWYDYNGITELDQSNPSYYSLDPNNFPDCPPNAGSVYCEIYAQASQWVYGEPDLTTIINQRMRP